VAEPPKATGALLSGKQRFGLVVWPLLWQARLRKYVLRMVPLALGLVASDGRATLTRRSLAGWHPASQPLTHPQSIDTGDPDPILQSSPITRATVPRTSDPFVQASNVALFVSVPIALALAVALSGPTAGWRVAGSGLACVIVAVTLWVV
jgi:hypothetical protein